VSILINIYLNCGKSRYFTPKLPLTKLFLAGLSLVVLIIFGKHFLGDEPADKLQPGGTTDVLGAQTPSNQIQPSPAVNQNPAATSSPTNTSTNNQIPAKAPSKNQIKITNTPTGYLNVRATPATSGKLVTQVHPGEIYPYTAVQNNWYNITLIDGRTGWVTGQYVSVVQN